MNMPKEQPENTEKKTDLLEELKTESPVSEKDEVKVAERKTAKLHKKAAEIKKK